MVFNAAKDLVYTINGGNISSGGYRISKILNGKSKKKGKQMQQYGGGGGHSSIFKEDSGIPIGLLLMQRLHFEPERPEDEDDNGHIIAYCKNKEKKEDDINDVNLHENKKLVYASIMAESENDDDDRGIELVITPSGLINPIEISSNEIDHELYDSLLKSVLGSESVVMSTPFRKTKNATKKQNFGKHKDIEKVYQKRKTRSKR